MKRIKKLIGWVDYAPTDHEDEIKVLALLDDDTMQFITMYHMKTEEYALARKNADNLLIPEDCENWDWEQRYESTYIEYFYGGDEIFSETWNIEYEPQFKSYVPCIELGDIDDLRGTYACIQDNPGYTVEKITDNKYKIVFE